MFSIENPFILWELGSDIVLYYLISDCWGNHKIYKRDDKGKGVDGLIATFTCRIHAEICLDTFNTVDI